MNRIDLHGKLACTVVSAGTGAAIPGKNLVGISVGEIVVDTGRFRSRDLTPRREGVLALTVGGQESIFPFTGKGRVAVDPGPQIAFLGGHPGPLGVSVRLVEFDAKARKALLQGGRLAAVASQASGVFGVPFAGTGFGVAGAFMKLLAKLVQDDDEIIAFDLVDQPLTDGMGISLDFGTGDGRKLSVRLEVHDFGKRETFTMLGVRVVAPWLEFGSQRISVAEGTPERGRRQHRSYPVAEWLQKKKGLSSFSFTAASGRHKAGVVSRFKGMTEVFGWERYELFRVAAASARDRHLAPLAMAFSLNTDSEMIEPVLDLVRAGAEFGAELNPELEPLVKVVRKTGRGVADLVAELADSELPLFRFEGALLLLPKGVDREPGTQGGRLQLAWKSEGLWAADVVCDIRKWQKKPLGRFGFSLEVGLVDG